MVEKRTINVFMLSFGFMLLFVSFQTMSNILDTIITSIKKDDPSYKADAMIGLCIVYIVLAISNFLAPPIIKLLGPRISMILGGLAYAGYIGSFLLPQPYVLYAASAGLGFGAAIIWTAQGKYLTDNSDNLTIARNAGIFWGLFQCSQFIGNLYVYFAFQKNKGADKDKFIDKDTRKNLYIILTAVSGSGVFFLLLLRRAAMANGEPVQASPAGSSGIRSVLKLFFQRNMILLAFSFWFTGALLSFAGSIYGNCIGYTLKIAADPKPLVGLSGVLLAFGEVLGGTLFGILGPRTVVWGRNPIIFLGLLVIGAALGLIYVNIPELAPFGNTSTVARLNPPNLYIALGCSFLLGFGDSCFNTQIYSIIGTLYHNDSAPAFAVFKFVQSVATGLGFIYAKRVGLRILLAIIGGLLVVAFLTFAMVEKTAAKIHKELAVLTRTSGTSSSRSNSEEKID